MLIFFHLLSLWKFWSLLKAFYPKAYCAYRRVAFSPDRGFSDRAAHLTNIRGKDKTEIGTHGNAPFLLISPP